MLDDVLVGLGAKARKKKGKLTQTMEHQEQKFMALQQAHAQNREAIARAWDRTCLRRGERLRLGLRACRRTRVRVKQSHPNAWTLTGTLSLAFRSIGQTAPAAKGLRQTRREVDAVSAVALAH